MKVYFFIYLIIYMLYFTKGLVLDSEGFLTYCEGHSVKLSCQYSTTPYAIFMPDEVLYGTFVGICGETTTNCTTPEALTQLTFACENKSSCTFEVFSSVYGLSCGANAVNAIRIKFTCVPSNQLLPTNLILDGWWSDWLPWSPCSATIVGQTGTKTRNRTCTDPAPKNGYDCKGVDSDSDYCTADETTTLASTCCSCPSTTDVNITSEELRDKIDEMKNELAVDKKALSSSVRKKTSAADDRPSSVAMGTVAIVFLTFFTIGVIGMDLKRIFDVLKFVGKTFSKWTVKNRSK